MTTAMRTVPDLDALLDWERAQPDRHEFVGGSWRMMVGGTLAHNTITLSIVLGLVPRIADDRCRVYAEGVKLRTATALLYPDAMVTCEAAEPTADLVTAPRLIAEVLSPSTADRDRGAKWQEYQTLASLEAYLLVAQDRPAVELYRRAGTGWRYDAVTGLDAALDLPGLTEPLPLAEIWQRVPLT
jgi:Uma2 family endonuclease